MGGVRSASVVVNCDRCKKDVMVTDDDQANHYRAFAARDDVDDRMFVAILNGADGKTVDCDMEYVCPKCVDLISGFIDKIMMKSKKDDGEPVVKKKRKAKKKEEKAEEEPAEEPEIEEPAVEQETKGEEFEDDELFD